MAKPLGPPRGPSLPWTRHKERLIYTMKYYYKKSMLPVPFSFPHFRLDHNLRQIHRSSLYLFLLPLPWLFTPSSNLGLPIFPISYRHFPPIALPYMPSSVGILILHVPLSLLQSSTICRGQIQLFQCSIGSYRGILYCILGVCRWWCFFCGIL